MSVDDKDFQGLDFTSKFTRVLLWMRQWKLTLIVDTDVKFHKVHARKDDKDLPRLLWTERANQKSTW